MSALLQRMVEPLANTDLGGRNHSHRIFKQVRTRFAARSERRTTTPLLPEISRTQCGAGRDVNQSTVRQTRSSSETDLVLGSAISVAVMDCIGSLELAFSMMELMQDAAQGSESTDH